MNKVKLFTIITAVFVLFTAILLTHEVYHNKVESDDDIALKNEQIIKATNSFLEYLKIDISKKVDILLANTEVQKAFYEQNREALYKYTESYYKRQTILNPYMKIMTFRLTDGSTFLRVHKPQMYGDALNKKRTIILDTNQLKKRHYGFEIGKLKMTYRIVTPVFYKGEHVGLVEVGIEPEYLIDKLNHTFEHIKSALLVKYDDISIHKQKIKSPVMIDKYLLARGDELFKENSKLLSTTNDIVVNYKNKEHTISTNLNLFDHKNKVAAKILFAYEIEDFKEKLFEVLVATVSIITILMIILFVVINFVISQFLKQLEAKKDQIKTILDASESIVVVSDGKTILDANSSLLKFFGEFENLEQFKAKYDCICDRFEKFEADDYLYEKEIDGLTWADYIIKHPEINFKVLLKNKDSQAHHFIINANKIILDNKDYIVVDLSDITQELEQQKIIEEKNKLLFEQSKMASMGEMIANIAHQWRQPLSVISAASTGVKFQKEFGDISDKKLIENMDTINNNAQYLSKTIDDFRNFIRGDKKRDMFDLKDNIDSFLHLVKGPITNEHINIILDLKNDVKINGCESELIQCFINIFNNSKDALAQKSQDERFISIATFIVNENVIIKFKDSAGGIPNDVLPRIFEPYYTTKHQSQGTGLGLNMTYKLITESMSGTITAHNSTFKYDGKNYNGAEFVISLPISS